MSGVSLLFVDSTFIHVNEVIKYNDKESLKSAVHNGFNVNQKDKFYKSPLMLACLEGNLDAAQYLIKQKYVILFLVEKFLLLLVFAVKS